MSKEQKIIKRNNSIRTVEEITETANQMAKDLSGYLKEDIEELNISSHLFRSGMERYIFRVLNALFKNPKPIAIFPDSVPGFTLIVFKKNPEMNVQDITKKEKRNPVEEMKQSEAVEDVMGRFFNQNKQKVIVIENDDMIFGLFPVADTRQNLKSMDLYITY